MIRLKRAWAVVLDGASGVTVAWFAWTLQSLEPIHLEHTRTFLCISFKCTRMKLLRGLFFTYLAPPSSTHTHGLLPWAVGGGLSGSGLDLARTFTADTFFAHLLTLRMFRVYVLYVYFPMRSHGGHSRKQAAYCLCFLSLLSKSSHELIFVSQYFCYGFLYCTHCDTSLDSGKW